MATYKRQVGYLIGGNCFEKPVFKDKRRQLFNLYARQTRKRRNQDSLQEKRRGRCLVLLPQLQI